jgi:outer membrane receptor for ferrienterochelin and colicin
VALLVAARGSGTPEGGCRNPLRLPVSQATANQLIQGFPIAADLSAIWHFWKGLELRAGVNNVFDKDPPILPSGDPISQAANTYPTYDILGRNLFVAVSAKF